MKPERRWVEQEIKKSVTMKGLLSFYAQQKPNAIPSTTIHPWLVKTNIIIELCVHGFL